MPKECSKDLERVIEKSMNDFIKLHLRNTISQWTVFSALYVSVNGSWRQLCCATGTSCLNMSQLTTDQDKFYKIHDSHAEILVRRALIL